jgi:hypothetical protein
MNTGINANAEALLLQQFYQPRTGCGHAKVGFNILKLGVGMQR